MAATSSKKPTARKTAPRAASKAKSKAPAKKPATKAKKLPPAPIKPPVSRADAPIVLGLEAKSSAERMEAARRAEAQGRKASPAVATALTAALQRPDAATRKAVLTALVALGPAAEPALPFLVEQVRGSAPLAVRGALAVALVKLDTPHTPAALGVLAETLQGAGASDGGLVADVLGLVQALGPLAAPLLPALLQRLQKASAHAASALLSAIRAIGPLATPAIRDALLAGEKSQGEALVHLVDAFNRSEDTLALGELVHAPALPVRLAAIAAIGRRRAREGLPDLLKALQDSSRDVAAASVTALRTFEPSRLQPVVAAFLTRLRQDPPEQRNRAVVTLSELGIAAFDEIGPLLLDGLADAEVSTRARAARGLEALAIEGRAALPRLRAQRKDPHEAVRAAVEAAIIAIEQKSPK
jgi:hypothetical protein